MLSKNKIKFINSIKKKKYREIHKCFFAEGEKLVDELLNSNIQIMDLFATPTWIDKNRDKITSKLNIDITEVTESELNKISALTTPNEVFAVAKQAESKYEIKEIKNDLSLFLESINDPGNLGTIIRIADWFGIKNIFCSEDSVDVYNPKVVQASMGAIYRIKTHYVNTNNFLTELSQINDYNIYGTFLEGDFIYQKDLSKNGLIIMGSESHGISKNVESFITQKLFIPNYPQEIKTSESLNISVATAIVCSEFRRRLF